MYFIQLVLTRGVVALIEDFRSKKDTLLIQTIFRRGELCMTILKIQNMTKKFGKFTALSNLDLEVKEGEVVGFIGPNGAGSATRFLISA